MFDLLNRLAQLQHELEYLSALTSLSVGALIVIGLVIWLDPGLRKLAIRCAVLVVYSYGLAIWNFHAGAAVVRAQWSAADAAAAIARIARDNDAAAAAAAEEAAAGAELKLSRTSDQEQLDALIRADQACHPITADQLR